MEPHIEKAGSQAAPKTETVVQDSNEIDNISENPESAVHQKFESNRDIESAKTTKDDSSITDIRSRSASEHGDLKDNAAGSARNLESNEIEHHQEVVQVHNPGMVFKTGLYTKAYHSEYSDY